MGGPWRAHGGMLGPFFLLDGWAVIVGERGAVVGGDSQERSIYAG